MGNSLKPCFLKNRSDFIKVSRQGQKAFSNSWLMANFLENHLNQVRYGWTIPKYVGSSVLRNKFKRWCRENIRKQEKKIFPKGVDINFVFKKKESFFYKKLKRNQFDESMEKMLKNISKKCN